MTIVENYTAAGRPLNKHCTSLFGCIKEGKNNVVLHERLLNLFDKMVRQMSILTKLFNLHFYLKWKDILPKKLSSNLSHSLAYPP